MGCCYSTPIIIDASELEKGSDLEPLVPWRFPDPCKRADGMLGGVPAPPSASPPKPPSISRSVEDIVPVNETAGLQDLSPSSQTFPSKGGAGSLALRQQIIAGRASSTPSRLSRSSLLPLGAAVGRSSHLSPEFMKLQYRDLTPEDYELLCMLDEALPKKGTTPVNLVSGLPTVLACDCEASECQICLVEFQNHTRVVRLPCNHVFHPCCISKWLTQCNGSCPLCLRNIKCALDKDVLNSVDNNMVTVSEVEATIASAFTKANQAKESGRPAAPLEHVERPSHLNNQTHRM